MIDRIDAVAEDARRSLPAGFQDRPVLKRISTVVDERSARLRKALAEDG